MMKTMMIILIINLLLATRLVVFCEEKNIEFLHTRNESELGSSQLLFNPKSHIEKFADSWRFYAKANDIAQREKLKMALRDALHSIERPEKHSLISNNLNSVTRVKQAVVLLKEFKRMYSLSDAVKRTLGAYQKAKMKLRSQVIGVSNNVMPETKVGSLANKRDIIPIYNHESVDENRVPELKLQRTVILRRTSKISVKASPLNNGDVGVEYSSIDPQYSNVDQAQRAVRAAKIILAYSGRQKNSDSISDYLYGRNKDSSTEADSKRKSRFPVPRRHWEGEEKGLSKVVRDKSGDADDIPGEGRSGVSSLMESLANGDDDLSAEDKAAIESLGTTKLESDSSSISDKTRISTKSKKGVVNQYVGQLKKLYSRYLKIKEENDTVENALQFQNEIINSNLGNASRDMIGNLTIVGTNELVENAVNKSKEEERYADMKEDVKPVVKSIDDDVSATNKQEDTLKELKEARLAKARYEVAKQDLAHKIKELYILANNYEKDETENQILEVKNLITHTPHGKETVIPGAHGYHTAPTPALELTTSNITERDEVHPGFAKSSIASKPDDEHKGSSMGAVETGEHQVEEATSTDAKTAKKQYEYLHLPSKHKAVKKEEPDKSAKNDDETLNIIAQALKEDMKDVEKLDNNEGGKDKDKENKTSTEGISEDHNDTKVKALEKAKDNGDNKDNKGEDAGKLQENKAPTESTSEDHTDPNIKALEKDIDSGDKGDKGEHKDKAENKDNKVNDEKHKQVNILTEGKGDPDTKHALPQHYNESVDEYLTKALQEIISADTSNSNTQVAQETINENKDLSVPTSSNPAAANWPEENDIDENNINPTEHNKNVVENAMKQHARNPNLPLPLVDTKGDKIKLNPAINATVPEGEALTPTTPAPSTTTTASTTPESTTAPPSISELAQEPVHESMQPIAATKPEPKPIQQPTAVLLHATEKNVSTALPDIDLHDPENKNLLDKASHMEESIAAAQDKLYSEAELKLGVSDLETHNKGASSVETSTKESERQHKEEPFSRNTMATQNVKPVATSFASVARVPGSTDISSQTFPYYQHKIDPYGSINEKVQGIDHITDVEEDPVIDEGGLKNAGGLRHVVQNTSATHHRHHHHHHANVSQSNRLKRAIPEIPFVFPPSEYQLGSQDAVDAMQNHVFMYQNSLADNPGLEPTSLQNPRHHIHRHVHRKYSIPQIPRQNNINNIHRRPPLKEQQGMFWNWPQPSIINQPHDVSGNTFLPISQPFPYQYPNNNYDFVNSAYNQRPNLVGNPQYRQTIAGNQFAALPSHRKKKHHHRHHRHRKYQYYGTYQPSAQYGYRPPFSNYQGTTSQNQFINAPSPYAPQGQYINEPVQPPPRQYINEPVQSPPRQYINEPVQLPPRQYINEPVQPGIENEQDERQRSLADEPPGQQRFIFLPQVPRPLFMNEQQKQPDSYRYDVKSSQQQPVMMEPREQLQPSYSSRPRDALPREYTHDESQHSFSHEQYEPRPRLYYERKHWLRNGPPYGPERRTQNEENSPGQQRSLWNERYEYDKRNPHKKEAHSRFLDNDRTRQYEYPGEEKVPFKKQHIVDPTVASPPEVDQFGSSNNVRNAYDGGHQEYQDQHGASVDSLDDYTQALTDRLMSINQRIKEQQLPDEETHHQVEDDDEPTLHHHHHRHHHHRRHHHRRHHHDDDDDEPDPDGADPDDDDDEGDDGPDDEPDDDDDDDDDEPDKDKKSKIKYVDGEADKRSFNNTAKYNSTVAGLDESTLTKDDASEDVHIEELEDEKRSDIPTYPKRKSEVSKAKSEDKKQDHKGYPSNEKTAKEKKTTKGKNS